MKRILRKLQKYDIYNFIYSRGDRERYFIEDNVGKARRGLSALFSKIKNSNASFARIVKLVQVKFIFSLII